MPRTTAASIRRALVSLACLAALIAAGLRAPPLAQLHAATIAAGVEQTASPQRELAIQQRAELSRVPFARPAPGPELRGAPRLRDTPLRGMHLVDASVATACPIAEPRMSHRRATCSVWSRGPRTRAELMVFLL